MIKKIRAFTVLAVIAQSISIYYSFQFYNDINTFFGLLIVLFEITLFVYLPKIKEAKNLIVKMLMISIVSVIVLFSILGVVANGYNFILKSNQNQFKRVSNGKYNVYVKRLKRLETSIKTLEKSRTTLESRTNILKPWENKERVITEWSIQNEKINTDIRSTNEKIDKLVVPNETKMVRQKVTGYTSIFKYAGLKENTCIFILTLTVAIILQLIILTARLYATSEPEGVRYKKNKNATKLEGVRYRVRYGVRYKKKLGTELGTGLENPEVKKKLGTELGTELGTQKDELKEIRHKKNKNTTKLEGVRYTKNKNTTKLEGVRYKKKLGAELGTNDVIESYISKSFKINDIIKTSQLKKDLQITDREWKMLDKNKLKGVEKIGTKLKRIN